MIIPVPDRSEWPKTPDGTTDWHVLFHQAETGLVTIIAATESPEQLKRQTDVIVRAIFNRKRDKNSVKKITAFLNKLIPDDADAQKLPAMKASLQKMFEKVEENRIAKAAAYAKKQKTKTPDDGDDDTTSRSDRRAGPIADFFHTNRAAKITLIASVVGLIAVAGIFFYPEKKVEKKVDVGGYIAVISTLINEQMPQKTWSLLSMKRTKKTEITAEILVSETDHIKAIRTMKRMSRVAIIDQVCPLPNEAMKKIIADGWTLWITLRSAEEKLTGGTCQYQVKTEDKAKDAAAPKPAAQ